MLILGETYIFVMFAQSSDQGAKALIFISQILFAGMLFFLAYWILKNIKRKIRATQINLKKFLSSLVMILLVVPSVYIIPLALYSLTAIIFGNAIIYVGRPLMVFSAILIYIQGIFLTVQVWLNPNLAYYRDIFFGAIIVIFSFILLAFNFRMDITTQLMILLLCSVILFAVFDTMRLRKDDSHRR